MPYTIPDNDVAFNTNQSIWFQTDIDILVAALNGEVIFSGCAPTSNSNMTVAIAAGVIQIADGSSVTVTGGNVTIGTADVTNPRIDLITASATGVKTVTAGTAAANPKAPALPAGHIAIAMAYVPANDTVIATNQITDKRVFGGGAPSGPAGGELAGTYPNPTVAATHAGSAHHAQSHDHGAAGDGTALTPASVTASGLVKGETVQVGSTEPAITLSRGGPGALHAAPSSGSQDAVWRLIASAGGYVSYLAARASGDTDDRAQMSSDGHLRFGPGNATTDTDISRPVANTLRIGSTSNLLRMGGTSFPASPANGDMFTRTDRYGTWYVYNSSLSKWIGQIGELAINVQNHTLIGSDTIGLWAIPTADADNILLSYVHITAAVAGTHDVNNYWELEFRKLDSAGNITVVGSNRQTSKSGNLWHKLDLPLGGVLSGTGYVLYYLYAYMIGSPGNLEAIASLQYYKVGS